MEEETTGPPKSILQLIAWEISQHSTTLLLACLFILIWKQRWTARKFTKEIPGTKRILLVTAHPDDEVMFFGPICINMIQQMKNHIYILCLSAGDYSGEGSRRTSELWRSCTRLGMRPENITMLKFDELHDHPTVDWSVDLLTRVIENHVISHSIDTLITFDGRGVSGHKNHIACYNAVKQLLAQPRPPPNVRVFLLDSVNLFRKYCLSMFDVFLSYYISEYLYVVNWAQRSQVVAGMKSHVSQLTWYRQLYLIFSRYILVNSLSELKVKGPPKKVVGSG